MLKIKQNSEYVSEDWWRWSVELEGPKDELDAVECVVYRLHPTFPKPVRRVLDRATNFRLETAGWGGFTIYATVRFTDGREVSLEHELELYYPDNTKNTK
jgi:transcription initiation factor IIF auxiliary subunit